MSPEQIENKPYDQKIDIYSLGLILLEICYVFNTASERRIVLENVRNSQLIPTRIKEDGYDLEYELMVKMCQKDPALRPSTQEILASEEYLKLKQFFNVENVYDDNN
jgi:translation initiation factor 2-alpha kinase 4